MKTKHEGMTKAICNKGFSGMQRFVARFNISCNLIEKCPAIPYCLHLNRFAVPVQSDERSTHESVSAFRPLLK